VIDNRRFHYAIIASIGLHSLVLLLFPDLLDASRRGVQFPPPIIARLMEPEPAPAPAAAAAPQYPAAAAPAETPVAKKTAKPQPKAPKAAPERPQLPAPPEVEARAESAPDVELPAAPAVAAIEPHPVPPPQAAEAPESLSRDQYRLQLIDEARRHKRYPPLARENNWQGDVLVGVLVGANGRASVTLKGSSGYEVLDRQALEMFRQAARAVTVPSALRGKEFALDVRAVYGLEE
jgi:periplasmic protein TonB